MAQDPELDDVSAFEAKETARKLPAGWLLLFWGLVVWGAWYAWSYTPGLGGWSQAQDLDRGGASSSASIAATVAFTAIPTIAAVVLMLRQRRQRKA